MGGSDGGSEGAGERENKYAPANTVESIGKNATICLQSGGGGGGGGGETSGVGAKNKLCERPRLTSRPLLFSRV